MTRIDSELVGRSIAGDAEATADLLRQCQVDLRRYALRTCRDRSDAEDAIQESLIVIYRRVGALRQAKAFSSWIFRIVTRECRRLAARITGTPLDDRQEEIERRLARMPQDDLRMDLARAIESLPAQYRAVVVLRDMEELTVDEITQRLGASREAVKARLHRGRALLREYLSKEIE